MIYLGDQNKLKVMRYKIISIFEVIARCLQVTNTLSGKKKTVTPNLRCYENNGTSGYSNNDITVKANLNSSETICCLLLKLAHLDIIYQVFLVLTAKPVCL